MRRWEKARLDNFFTYEQKSSLKESDREHILLVDESGKFELQPCEQMTEATSTINQLRAFSFNRSGRLYVVFWHTSGNGKLTLKLDADKIHLYKNLGQEIKLTKTKDGVILPLSDRHYLEIDIDKDKVISAFKNAKML